MSKILAMCPSRGRPKLLEEMLESFHRTKSKDTCMVVYLNEDDPKLPEYRREYRDEVLLIVGPRKYLSEAYNLIFKEFPDKDYYVPINDDHFFVTPEWDKKLIEVVETKGRGWGLAAAEDYLTDWDKWPHPSGCVISGNIPRTLGYFIWDKIQHIGIDDYLQYLMQGIGGLFHVPEVVIEHRHWINGKRFLDENYKWVYSQEQSAYGRKMVQEYLRDHLNSDVLKLMKGIGDANLSKDL